MKTRTIIWFCNDAPELLLTNSVEVNVADDGFALLAPYGDTQYELPDANGKVQTVIQRITKDTAVNMVNTFNSVRRKISRWLFGSPIYAGHPDEPTASKRYPDKSTKGLFSELQVREDGLYVRPVFNNEGAALLQSGTKLYFSGRWPARQTGQRDGMAVWEPFDVTSIGLTPNPNLHTELLNERFGAGAPDNGGDASGVQDTNTNIMEKKKLITLLGAVGVASLTNEADDAAIEAAIKTLGANASRATTLANEKQTAESAITTKDSEIARLTRANTDQATQFANERKTLLDTLLTDRQKAGYFTEADRKVWEGRLTANFTNEFPEFNKLQKTVKTDGADGVDGSRRDVGDANKAAQKIVDLTNERIAKFGEAFDVASRKVAEANPDLVRTAFGPAK